VKYAITIAHVAEVYRVPMTFEPPPAAASPPLTWAMARGARPARACQNLIKSLIK
jgi:hypothetical protein